MTQNDYERLVQMMFDKGVKHEAFELLADLRKSERIMTTLLENIGKTENAEKKVYVHLLGSEGAAVMRNGTIEDRKNMLANRISPVYARCENMEDAEHIADCVNACNGITKQGLKSGIVKNSIKASFLRLRYGMTEELKVTIEKESKQ